MANEVALKKAFEDEAFVKELAEMETPEEVRDALNAKGAEITVEEVKAIAKSLSAQAAGEMVEDELADVAGGAVLDDMRKVLQDSMKNNPLLWQNDSVNMNTRSTRRW